MDLWFHNHSYSYKDYGMVTTIAITHFWIYIGEDRWRLVSSTEVDTSIGESWHVKQLSFFVIFVNMSVKVSKNIKFRYL